MQNRSTVFQIKLKFLVISLLETNFRRGIYYYPYTTCVGMEKINQIRKTVIKSKCG